MIKIKDYINNNYNISGNLTFENINEIYVVNCDGDVEVKNKKIIKLTNGFVWGEVKGDFDCSECNNLESLEGAPKEVSGYFDCSNCKKLESLEGSPEKVGGYFDCSRCENLKSLEGAPKEVKGRFIHDNI